MRRRWATALLLVGLSLVFFTQPAGAATPPRVRITAEVSCLTVGGIGIDFTVANTGAQTVHIDPDFHLLVEAVRQGGRQPGVVLFVFPAPGFDRIPPGESRTFLLTAGEPFEGEPAIDFSGHRLIIEAEVWLRERGRPVDQTLTFPAC